MSFRKSWTLLDIISRERLFSDISTTCSSFGFFLKISMHTAEPIEPAPPITRNFDSLTNSLICALYSFESRVNSSVERPTISKMSMFVPPLISRAKKPELRGN